MQFMQGLSNSNSNSFIKATFYKKYLQIENFDLSTKEENFLKYFHSDFSNEEFVIEKCSKRNNAESILFKVTVNSNIFLDLLAADQWLEEIKVKKFFFKELKQNSSPKSFFLKQVSASNLYSQSIFKTSEA